MIKTIRIADATQTNTKGGNVKLIRLFFVVAAAAALTGCGSQPRTADDLRMAVKKDAMFTSHDEFVVNKPFRQVSDNMKKKWTSCLDTSANVRVYRGNGMYAIETHVYKPTVLVKGTHAELALQHKVTGGGTIQVGSPPPDGFYIIVADIDAASGSTTRINLQKQTTGHGDVMKIAREWAEGSTTACPDMSE